MYLRLLPRLKIWKRVFFPVQNVIAKKLKDCLTDLDFAVEVGITTIFPKTVIPLLHEVGEISVLCERMSNKNNPDILKISGLFLLKGKKITNYIFS
ncbi:MAG: hypothetical protein PHH19_06435 [Eubacteriales bacterium]|nr:hypothetical protein [Eubacteriales bacterium]